MTDEQQALTQFRTTSMEMGLSADEVEDAIARASQVAVESGLPLGQVLAEETAERSVHMGREG